MLTWRSIRIRRDGCRPQVTTRGSHFASCNYSPMSSKGSGDDQVGWTSLFPWGSSRSWPDGFDVRFFVAPQGGGALADDGPDHTTCCRLKIKAKAQPGPLDFLSLHKSVSPPHRSINLGGSPCLTPALRCPRPCVTMLRSPRPTVTML